MGLGFLAPLFLAGLAALAIPLLVHLTHKERKEPVIFPSLMFLQKIPFRTQRRQRLRNIVLFLLRAAAVILLVGAFARPFLARQSANSGAGRDVVLLIDRSASMGARGRWERAAREAAAVVAGRAPGARMAVIAFDDRAEGLTELTDERAPLEAAVADIHPGSAAGRYAPGLQAAAALLERSNAGGEVVLVSDFQRAGWDGSAATRLPPGVTLRTIDVGDTTLANVGVTGVILDRETGAEPKTTIAARVAGSRGAARDVPVTLMLEERSIQTVTVRVAPGASAVARFTAVRDPGTTRRARIVIPADDQPADDAWHFVLGPSPRLGVLVLARGDAAASDLVYVREALGVARDPSFPMAIRTPGAVRAADFANTQVVVIHDAPFPGGDAGRRLLDFARAGGGLFIALGSRGTLPAELTDSLGAGTAVADRGDLGAALAVTDAAHPVFAGWGDRADLGASRAFRYRRLDRARAALARYDDGLPALAETKLGAGRVLVWTADLANRWSDAPLHAAFVPLLHGSVRYLAGFVPPPSSRLVGDVVEQRIEDRGETKVIVQSPGGRRRELGDNEAGFALRERGFYEVEAQGSQSSVLYPLVAVNVPAGEADPARVVPEQLAAAVAPAATAQAAAAAGIAGPAERERGQRLWWYVLLSVLLLLAAESAVAHRARGTR